jgi:hypothetical protein
MPIRIKPAATSKAKYVSNTARAGQSYADGINNSRRDWQAATSSAEGTWEARTQAAIQNKTFSKGITPDAANKQKTNAINLDKGRYPTGTANAQETPGPKTRNPCWMRWPTYPTCRAE